MTPVSFAGGLRGKGGGAEGLGWGFPLAQSPAACGHSRWAQGGSPLPPSQAQSQGWGVEKPTPWPPGGQALPARLCESCLICSLNNSLPDLSGSIRTKTKPDPDLLLRLRLHGRQARRPGRRDESWPACTGPLGLATFQKQPGAWFCTALKLRIVFTF